MKYKAFTLYFGNLVAFAWHGLQIRGFLGLRWWVPGKSGMAGVAATFPLKDRKARFRSSEMFFQGPKTPPQLGPNHLGSS